MQRRAASATLLAATIGLSVLLAGCGQQSGLALARQACGHVQESIKLYRQSATSSQATAAHDQELAYDQLRDALPLAARATSDDGDFNALMTTISESARVSEGDLITALSDQCAVVQSNQPVFTPTPTTLPPIPTSTPPSP